MYHIAGWIFAGFLVAAGVLVLVGGLIVRNMNRYL